MDPEDAENLTQETSHLRISGSGNLSDSTQPLSSLPYTARVTNSHTRVHNITGQFIKATQALGTGQLVKDEFFTLFEAVGALEIMDPKMDSGYLAPGQSLEDSYDVLGQLLPEEVVGIMDQLLCSEVAWYTGHHLSQTLFSSLYIDRLLWPEPKSLEQACFDREDPHSVENPMLHVVLRSYCISLIKVCDFVHRQIINETFYEEEDFVSNLYNRKLVSDLSLTEVNGLLNHAIRFVESKKISLSDTAMGALSCRLNFRKHFLHAVSLEPDVTKSAFIEAWAACSRLLPEVLESNKYGISVPESISPKIQRRLASTVPPRPIVVGDFKESYEYLRSLFEDGKATGVIFDCQCAHEIMTFVSIFGFRKPQPSVYIRCLLSSMIQNKMRVNGEITFTQFIFDDLSEVVLPADISVDTANYTIEAPQDPRFQIMSRMDMFVSRVGQSYLDVVRACNMNRSRMRRMLCHTILDWENIQLDAEDLDVELRKYTMEEPLSGQQPGVEEVWSFPLSSWAYHLKLRQMEWIVQLGFELKIYRDDELAGMYWYLQYLANTRLQHLQRIQTFTSIRHARIESPTSDQTAAFQKSFAFLEFSMKEASATQSLSDALSCLYIALIHLSLIPTNTAPTYSTPQLRHALRMRPFAQISIPNVPTYDQLATRLNPFQPIPPKFRPVLAYENANTRRLNSLLDSAEISAKIARKWWDSVSKCSAQAAGCSGCEKDWRSKQKDVLRSVIALSIAVADVKRWAAEGKKEGRIKVEVDTKGYHDWWIVPKVNLA